MSVRDLVWVNACQRLRQKARCELEEAKIRAEATSRQTLLLSLQDLLVIGMDADYYGRISAFKESPDAMRHLKPFDVDELPSSRHAFAQLPPEEQERRKIEKFLKGGGTYRPS